MSAARRTKLSARYSRPCSTANATSAQSFSVIDGALTATPGRFIPLWLLMLPPCSTRAFTVWRTHLERHELDQPVVDEDAVTDLHVVAEIIVCRGKLRGPGISRRRRVRRPRHRSTLRGAARSPMRMRGPCRSPMMATGRPSSLRRRAHQRDRLRMLLVRAVREVEPGDVESGLHEAAQRLAIVGRGAERADDLRAWEGHVIRVR